MQTIEIKDLVTKSQFLRIEKTFQKNFGFTLETTDIDGKEIRSMSSKGCSPHFCHRVRKSVSGSKRCRQDRIRSLDIAIETGQPYISLCHAGIVLICVPIMDRDTALGGLFFGKCLWEHPTEITEADILKRLRGLRLDRAGLLDTIELLPVIPGRKIHGAAEFLFILLYEITELDPRVIKWRRQKTLQQSEIGEVIQESKKLGIDRRYPYEIEQKLIGKVKIGDNTGAKEILNSLLGTIMFHSPGDLNLLKARLIELLSVLSRAAVEGGVDIHLLLEKNLDYINKVLDIDTQDDLCAWISRALNDFIESVYSAQDFGKITQIKPAIEFIEANYERPITLANIAKASHLSISRLAHLFKEQMGITLIDYLTSVRVEHAKKQLLSTEKSCTEICFAVGYNNQSYFTRTFKETVGTTPKRFRENNRRVKKINPSI